MLRKRFLDLLRTPLPHFLEKPHTLNYQTNYYFGFLATKQEKKKYKTKKFDNKKAPER